MITSTKAFLLAGASALAILACAAEANAETFTVPGMFSFAASVSGEYAVELLGASGGNSTAFDSVGGLGAEVSGDIFLTAGEDLALFVGEQGGSARYAGGGGGGSFVAFNGLAVAGGGGGAGFIDSPGGPGLAGTSGGAGTGQFAGGVGGVGGSGGGGGVGPYGGGGGGAGVKSGPAGYGGDGFEPGLYGAFGGKFPNGGAAGSGAGSGGYGGGGGGGSNGGGGGSGSYLAPLQFTDQVLKAGVNSGDGSISISLLTPAVPEPSTWAMMLMGFAGLGWLAHARRRKTSPA
jgi:PEP-CTERM motif